MCGIIGIASQTRIADRSWLAAGRDAMHHRGPDDAGEWWSTDGCIGLGHRRLSIIDLTPTGHQPMEDAGGDLHIVYNGEIYDFADLRQKLVAKGHVFRSACDTEVPLAAYREWGENCLSLLNGMFAFGLYDSRTRRLLLARDRAGEKPLYYRYTPGKLVFASELKAIMAEPDFPRCLDLEALNYYLAYGYVPGDKCILAGVHKLPAGSALIYELDTDRRRLWSYWRLPDFQPGPSASVDALVEELESLLLDSVRLRLVADVPVGILLSGGIDSSLVTAMAARVSSAPVHTYTISFPGHGSYDEAPHARMVAQYFGTTHIQMVAEPATVDLLPLLAREYDEPMADSSIVPTYLVSRLIRRHATVALGGDGGDELFGGYPYYSWIQQQEWIRRFMPGPFRHAIVNIMRMVPLGVKGRNFALGLMYDLSRSIAHFGLYFDSVSRQRLLAPLGVTAPTSPPESWKMGLCDSTHSLVQQATRVDFSTYLVDDILTKVDRAGMLTSLEVRAPWLDHRIIELAFSRVPDILRATKSQRKILPRSLAARLLPPSYDLTRKQGFSLPLQAWFKGEWGEYFARVLKDADPALFNRRFIQKLLTGQRLGLANTNRLFALTMFELWRREYHVSLPH